MLLLPHSAIIELSVFVDAYLLVISVKVNIYCVVILNTTVLYHVITPQYTTVIHYMICLCLYIARVRLVSCVSDTS